MNVLLKHSTALLLSLVLLCVFNAQTLHHHIGEDDAHVECSLNHSADTLTAIVELNTPFQVIGYNRSFSNYSALHSLTPSNTTLIRGPPHSFSS